MTNEMVLERTSNLVMPSHYVELDRDEMSYVDGGGTIYTWMVSAPIDIALMACGATLAFGGVKLLGKFFGKSLAKKLSKSMAPIVAKVIGLVSGGILNLAVGQVGQMLLNNFWSFTSLGGLVSFVLDIAIDGEANGVIYSW